MRFAFLIFLLLPVAGQVYVSMRTWQLLPAVPALRIAAVVVMALAFVAFFVAMSGVINRWPMGLARVTYEVGTSWLIILLYLFLTFLLLDVMRLCRVVQSAALHENGRLAAGLAILRCRLDTLRMTRPGAAEPVSPTLAAAGQELRQILCCNG